jgi:8-oxo-dGTP diphosphatase
MTLYLVRHAKAGSRRDWDGDDMVRPLSKKGWRQAEALSARLAPLGVVSLHTSPYLRCRQTLEPLGRALGLDVVDEPALTEGGPFEPVLDLLARLPDGAVLCSHGDIIPDTMAALVRRGCEVRSEPDWRKGSVWVLERGASGIESAVVWAPPDAS